MKISYFWVKFQSRNIKNKKGMWDKTTFWRILCTVVFIPSKGKFGDFVEAWGLPFGPMSVPPSFWLKRCAFTRLTTLTTRLLMNFFQRRSLLTKVWCPYNHSKITNRIITANTVKLIFRNFWFWVKSFTKMSENY